MKKVKRLQFQLPMVKGITIAMKKLEQLKENNQIVFTYEENPNGSVEDIAGIINEKGNVLGMMPHPERAVDELLGSADGLKLFQSIVKHWRETHVINA